MRELLPGIYDFQLAGTSSGGQTMYVSVFYVEGPTNTLIDTGWSDTTDDLIEQLTAAGVDVDRVFLTHFGRDHYGGLDRVMDEYAPELVVPGDETELVETIDHDPDELVYDGDTVDGMEVITLPGHTPAPASLYFPEHEALIAADVLDGSDRRGLPAGYLTPPPVRFNRDHAAAEESLARLLEYPIDSVLVFHGSHVVGGAGEKLDRLVNLADHFVEPAGVVRSEGRAPEDT